jgi:RHS repeat-associated protein
MTNLKQLLHSRALIILLAIAAVCALTSSPAQAQSSGAYVDECSTQTVDQYGTELSVCAWGSASQLYFESNADGGDWAYVLSTCAQLWVVDGSTQKYGFSCDGTNSGGGYYSLIPRINDVYTASGGVDELVDYSGEWGDGNDNPYWTGPNGFASVSVQVTPPSVTLSVATSGTPSTYGNPVTFTATISNGVTGTITFYDGGTSIGTGTISGTTATYTTSALSAGAHAITAGWAGDSNYGAVTSAAIIQAVYQAPVITTQPVSQSVTLGNPAMFSVAASGTPTLTYAWQYLNGSGVWKSWAVGTGYNTNSFTTLPTNTNYNNLQFRVVVTDGNGLSTTSNPVTLTVNPAVISLTVATSRTPSANGGSVTFTATISNGVTGTITFYDGITSIGSGAINGATATYTTSALSAGSHAITAGWAGNANYNSVTSSSITQVVSTETHIPGTVYSFAGSYAAAGNLSSYNDSVMGTWNFTYDTLNRLVTSHNTAASSATPQYANNYGCWSYDSFGNRTAQSISTTACPAQPSALAPTANYNSSNRVTWTSVNAAGSNFNYDPAGDVTNDNSHSYLYDAEGRICAVALTNQYGYPVMPGTGYLYDANGTRVAKGSISTWNCDPDTAANGFQTTNDYILGPGGEQVTEMSAASNNTMLWQHTNVYAAGKLLATYDLTGNGLHFYLNDPLGTRRAQTDYAGVLEQTCSSLPFGDQLSCSGSTTSPTEHHFTGKERDAESGNDYFEARYYSSAMGRFMSPDWSAKAEPVPYAKLDNPQSLNLYAYLMNNPLGGVDADGHGSSCADNPGICRAITQLVSHGMEAGQVMRAAAAVVAYMTGNQGPLSTPAAPASPPIAMVTTSISGGTTSLTVSTHDNTTTTDTWDSLTKVDSKYQKAHPTHTWLGRPLRVDIIGVETGVAGTRAYGPFGAAIKTTDPHGQWLHGGGGEADSQEPYQRLVPTNGCTRLHNQDAMFLGDFVRGFMRNNPDSGPVVWERTQ